MTGFLVATIIARFILHGQVPYNLKPGVIEMPKQKTHKGIKKRFKLTASGKAKHRNAFRGHLLSHKSAKQKRQLRKGGLVEGKEAVTIRDALRPAS